MKKLSSFVFFMGFAIACGGAEQSTLLTDGGDTADQSSPIDASQSKDASTNDVTIGPDDASVQDAPTIVDVVTVDVPIKPPPDSQIQCGTSSCSAQNQLCCYHVGTPGTFACVAGFNDCMNTGDVPINCSNAENCASEGQPNDVCCAATGGPPNPNTGCQNSTSASSVTCQATCGSNNSFVVGCSIQNQDCQQGTCSESVCSLPGYDICK